MALSQKRSIHIRNTIFCGNFAAHDCKRELLEIHSILFWDNAKMCKTLDQTCDLKKCL